MLWIDKYRPQSLDALTFHPQITALLIKMAEKKDLPHLLVHGPSGGGRKTRVSGLIKAIYGNTALKVRIETKLMKSGDKTIEIAVVTSNWHVEVNPSDAGTNDRIVVQELIKEVAQSRPIDSKISFKTIVVHEADKMSRGAQDALRRTMERYAKACRIILIGTSACRISSAIRSRCAMIRIPLPSDKEVSSALNTVSLSENFTLPEQLSERIAQESFGNTRKALLMLEASKVRNTNLTPEQPLERADWEEYLSGVALDIAQEQTPRRIAEVRMKIYELLSHCIPPELILRRLTMELLRKVDSQLQYDLINWAAFYEHRIHLGSKPIYHIEAFIARFMGAYSAFLLQAFA